MDFRCLLRLSGGAGYKETTQDNYCKPISPNEGHLITRSALASTFGGIVRPICLAVLRLMRNSKSLGCSTGMSAGFAPLSILSTYEAPLRPFSYTLGT